VALRSGRSSCCPTSASRSRSCTSTTSRPPCVPASSARGRPGYTTSRRQGQATMTDIAQALGWRAVRLPRGAIVAAAGIHRRLPVSPGLSDWVQALKVPVIMATDKARTSWAGGRRATPLQPCARPSRALAQHACPGSPEDPSAAGRSAKWSRPTRPADRMTDEARGPAAYGCVSRSWERGVPREEAGRVPASPALARAGRAPRTKPHDECGLACDDEPAREGQRAPPQVTPVARRRVSTA
jgi:hypothetical protein